VWAVSALMFQGEEPKIVQPFVAGTKRYIPGQETSFY